ncbi:oligosaccharide flippase family protein [Camelliibacillus cellulosilyticus]|uniref:Oligosaccharide flippase family protein n=1 Tax=Camelliibacillus cellulosilyticus TaxID=2174486 RepID=A0ABV9GNV5_9BACL
MSESRMIRGTLILSIAIFLSKFLGMLFVIPFRAIIGNDDWGGALYTLSYTPYAIILSISTVGIPMAVSKFVSKYNTLGDYRTGRRLYHSGLLFMMITGLVGFLIMYFGAPLIAHVSLSKHSGQIEKAGELIYVMRVLSFAILIVPAMSLIRGYFQGFQSMGPSAVSQTVEQIVRIVFGLAGAFIIMKVVGSIVGAVAFVTFGAFVGAAAGLVILMRYWIRRKPHLDRQVAESPPTAVRLGPMYKELIGYAIPFVAVGLANQLYLLIDQVTLNNFLAIYHHYSKETLDSLVANLMMYDQKLVMIPVSLATALGMSVVPDITSSYAEGQLRDMHLKITKALQFILFFTIPAAVGLSMLGHMVYGLLYSLNGDFKTGGEILRWYAPSAILFAGFSVTAAILQGINKQKVTVLSLGVGILLKMVLNPLFIKWWDSIGSIIATDVGYIASIAITLVAINYSTGYRFGFIGKRLLLIVIYSVIMGIGIELLFLVIGGSVPKTRFSALIWSILGVVVGGGIYLLLSLRTGLFKQVMGNRFRFLNRFMS